MKYQPLVRRASLLLVSVSLFAGCAGDGDDDSDDERSLEIEESANEAEDTSEAEEDDAPEDDPENAEESDGDDAGEGDAASDTGRAVDLPDTPQAYTSLLLGAEPAVEKVEGEVTIAWGSSDDSSIPFVIHNGTAGPISRLEVSGIATDAEGATLGSGRSQSVQPNIIEAGGYAIGFVYVGIRELENVEAVIENPAIDYTDGLGQFENITMLDVESVEEVGGSFIGTVSNPHEVEVDGPISVSVGCLLESGAIRTLFSTFADRDSVEAGGSSSFTAQTYSDDEGCAGLVVGASGYTDF